ncbi:acetate kinase (acetokinase) [Lactobacillus selangorensis]|uniref:Acetate kinase n=1 Tax=Lactobacillus selangorensis TaxID=81857 RepID=A0A0R2FZM2_9LACO|nr:acetate kinase [Lactobacillus selangorensis]KRN28912.1 acetate kinase (acetokinase) [Lactobacillus selangorensis]KRN32678.1 acetate kinase (acetokinase) [Lactobacillus selangorensis]
MSKVLAINAGSSSLKWKLFEMPAETVIAKGDADRLGQPLGTVSLTYQGRRTTQELAIPDHQVAVEILLDQLLSAKIITRFDEIDGVGHRVVAGGEIFKHSTLVDEKALTQIESLAEYAPLHNPAEAAGIRAFMKLLPDVPEVAVFDTSFHQTLKPVNYLYSLPYDYYEQYGARKFGAHGTSYRYVSQRTAELLDRPLADLKMIVAHLGNGASLDAIADGKSVDTSMGFTPLSGITMGTRSGDIDASLVAFLVQKLGISSDQMIDILNTKSGVLGISGISSDIRDLLDAEKAGDKRAHLALDIFVNRIIKYVGSYVALLKGLDVLVFTAGIGENAPAIRSRIVNQLSYFGIKLDEAENAADVDHEQIISTPDSKVTVMVVPTNEELMIARDVVRLGQLV